MAETKPGKYACPDCGKEFDMPGKVTFHRMGAHGYKGKSKAGATRTTKPASSGGSASLPLEAEVAKVVEATVGHLRGIGALLQGTVAPATGVTVMGVEVPAGTEGGVQIPGALGEDAKRWWLVRSRAVMAGPVIFEQAKRDARIFNLLQQFNRLFELGAGVEVVAGVVAAGAVDAGVPPSFGFQIGAIPVQPIPAVIPDVLDYLAFMEQENRASAQVIEGSASNGYRPAPGEDEAAQVVEGGVEAT